MYFKKIIFRAELNLLIVIFLIVKNFSLQKEIYYFHKPIHKNVYQFKCKYEGCEKSYYLKNRLKIHIRSHVRINSSYLFS